jgi:hypothetical protein
MLIAAKQFGCPLVEESIRTIYQQQPSHFKPLRGSMRVCIVLLNGRAVLPELWARLTADSILFIANFVIRRDCVLTRHRMVVTKI